MILAVGQPQDGLFGFVLVSNALIGIVQEVRAKRTLDRLAVLSAPRARVLRDGIIVDVAVEQVVIDDLVDVQSGDQIVVDGVVRTSAGLEIDESLLTGESAPVEKRAGDGVLSGSFVDAGAGRYQATSVGADAYARRLATEARRFAPVRSELIDGINRILRYVTWAIFPVGSLLLLNHFRLDMTWRDAVTGAVAGVVGMVPQGLVLVTSIAFGVAAISLARRQVLVHELPAVEGLARVDVVCLDKTGTLTDGSITFDRVVPLLEGTAVDAALAALADDENRNGTLLALAEAFPVTTRWSRVGAVPFSSARKWSAAAFDGHGTWVLGAPEMIWEQPGAPLLQQAGELADSGRRVLLLATTAGPLRGDLLPAHLQAVALVLFAERVRPDAAESLAFFAAQGVALKVISGDSPTTVAAVARQVGLPHADHPMDARELPESLEALGQVLEERTVFGRVTPQQKQSIVQALQARGHTVAMTGDGVNDALALKLADVGVAMGGGAPATRAVAKLVLLDGRFSTLPGVVAEGRRVTANIERVANLFVTKTIWAATLAIAVGIAGWPYPFLPRHLSTIDALTIGVPSFFLALAPNRRRYVAGFVPRVLQFTIPAGLIAAAAIFTAFAVARGGNLPVLQQRTAATLVTLIVSLFILVILAIPLTWRRVLLVAVMIAGVFLLFPLASVRTFYALQFPEGILGEILLIGALAVAMLAGGLEASRRAGRGPAVALGLVTTPGSIRSGD